MAQDPLYEVDKKKADIVSKFINNLPLAKDDVDLRGELYNFAVSADSAEMQSNWNRIKSRYEKDKEQFESAKKAAELIKQARQGLANRYLEGKGTDQVKDVEEFFRVTPQTKEDTPQPAGGATAPPPLTGWDKMKIGFEGSTARINQLAANLLNIAADAIEGQGKSQEETFKQLKESGPSFLGAPTLLGRAVTGAGYKTIAKKVRSIAEGRSQAAKGSLSKIEAETKDRPETFVGTLSEAAGGAPLDIARQMPMTRLLGPFGMPITEYLSNIDKGQEEALKAALGGAFMAGGSTGGKKIAGSLLQQISKAAPGLAKNLEKYGAQVLSEGLGGSSASALWRGFTGGDIKAEEFLRETLLNMILPRAEQTVRKAVKSVVSPTKAAPPPPVTPPPPPVVETQGPSPEPPPNPASPSKAIRGVSEAKPIPVTEGKYVVDPMSRVKVEIDPSAEQAFEINGNLYIVENTGVEASFYVDRFDGTSRKHHGRLTGQGSAAEAARSAARSLQPKLDYPQQTATSTSKPPTASSTEGSSEEAKRASVGLSPKKEKPPVTPPTATAPMVEAPAPAVAPLESVYTDTPKGKPQRTVAIKFENEQQKTLYDTIQNARTGDANAVTAKAEAVNKYAQENNVSTEEAQKILEGWATKTFMRAKNQPAEAPEGKRLEIEANPVPKPSNKKPANPPQPPVAETPAAESEPVKPETVTTETVVTPAPAATLPPPPVVEAATSQPQVEPPAVTPEVSATPAPEPIAQPTPPAKKATGKKKAAPPAGIPPVAAKAEEEVTTELPPAAIPTGMVEAAAAGTAARVKPPVPEGSEGMQSYSIRQNTPLYFENSNDLAIAKSGGKSQDLRKHVNKLGSLLLDGKPIVMQPDKAVQLMRDYRSHLTEVSSGVVPSIEEFATTIWKEKGRAALPQELAGKEVVAGPQGSAEINKQISDLAKRIEKETNALREFLAWPQSQSPSLSRRVQESNDRATKAAQMEENIKKLNRQMSTLVWRKERGVSGVLNVSEKTAPLSEQLTQKRTSTEASSKIEEHYKKESESLARSIEETKNQIEKLQGQEGKAFSQEMYNEQVGWRINKYGEDLAAIKEEVSARKKEREANDVESKKIQQDIAGLNQQDPIYVNGKKRVNQLSQRNNQLDDEISARDARSAQISNAIKTEFANIKENADPSSVDRKREINRLANDLQKLEKEKAQADAALKDAKLRAAESKKDLSKFAKSKQGKVAIEEEKKAQTERTEEQKRIDEWSKRYRSASIPGFEPVDRLPMAGTFAEQVSKMETSPVPERKTVPTVEALSKNSDEIASISNDLEKAKSNLVIRGKYAKQQDIKLDNLSEKIKAQQDAVRSVSGELPDSSALKRAQDQVVKDRDRLDVLTKNIEAAQSAIENGNLSDIRKRILEDGIRKRQTSISILKASIARQERIIAKEPGVPETYVGEKALERRGVGKLSSAQLREQSKLERLTQDYYTINENLKKYRERELHESIKQTEELTKKLAELQVVHNEMRARLEEVPGLSKNQINKMLEENSQRISKLGKDADSLSKKHAQALEDLESGVAKLQEKFEKTTAAKKGEAQESKTPESAITDEVYEKAVNATKEKKNVTRPFLRSVLSEYKLGKKSIDALMSRMKSEGVIDKSGILIEEVKPEPLPEPKPAKETKPKQTRKKEEVKPETKPEVKPEVKPEEKTEEKKTAKESPEVKISGSKFAREEDAKMYQAWIKNSDSFIRDNPGMAQKAITQLVEANEGLSKQKAMIALGKYMEAVNSMIIQKKPVPSLLDWYSKNK